MPRQQRPELPQSPESFLAALRNSHEHMRDVFRRGGCYELFRILRTIWVKAEPWFIDHHVYTRIDNRWWDIDGRSRPTKAQVKRLRPLFKDGRTPWKWRNRGEEARRGFQRRRKGAVQMTSGLRARLWLTRARIGILRLLLPWRLRRQIFNAMIHRAQADAITLYDPPADRDAPRR